MKAFLGKILVPDGTEGVKVNAPIAVMADEGGAACLPAAAADAPKQDAGETAAPVQSNIGGAYSGSLWPLRSLQKPNGHAPEAAHGDRIFASPLAKRMAQQAGIDLASLKGSGPNGRIVRADVEGARPGAVTRIGSANGSRTCSSIQAPALQAAVATARRANYRTGAENPAQ